MQIVVEMVEVFAVAMVVMVGVRKFYRLSGPASPPRPTRVRDGIPALLGCLSTRTLSTGACD